MGVDEHRDQEGDAKERTGLGQDERVGEGEQDVDAADRSYRDTEGDAEERTGLGSDPEGVDSGFGDAATDGGQHRQRLIRACFRIARRRHRRCHERRSLQPLPACRSALCPAKDPCSTWLTGRTRRPRKQGA